MSGVIYRQVEFSFIPLTKKKTNGKKNNLSVIPKLFGRQSILRYGRKTVVIGGNLLSAAGVLALAACPWYLGVLMCRFLLGITFSLTLLPSYSLGELLSLNHPNTVAS